MALVTASIAVAAGSAYMARKSAKEQTAANTAGNNAAIAEQGRQYDQTREDFSGYRDAGANALNQLENPLESFYADPGYDFAKSEGLSSLDNMYSAKGAGGNAMRAGIGYATGMADQTYGNWFNRTMDMARMGSGATGKTAQAGQNMANNNAAGHRNTATNNSQIQGNMYSNMNNAMTSGISNVLYGMRRPEISGNSYYLGDQPGKG